MVEKNNPQPETQAELARLVELAQKGDPTVLPALRDVLEANPGMWQHYGDLALQAEAAYVTRAAGNDFLMSECLLRKLAAMKAELAGPSASPLERLLAARIAVCWLETAYFTAMCAQAKGASAAQVNQLQRQLDSVNRRFLAATKVLATVRKLLHPGPTALDLLKFPVEETSGSQGPSFRREGFPAMGAAVVN